MLVEELGHLEGASPPKGEEEIVVLLCGVGVVRAGDVVEVMEKETEEEEEKKREEKRKERKEGMYLLDNCNKIK